MLSACSSVPSVPGASRCTGLIRGPGEALFVRSPGGFCFLLFKRSLFEKSMGTDERGALADREEVPAILLVDKFSNVIL